MRSGVLAIFKGKGAAKFSQILPTRNESGWIQKNGAVLLEAAPVVGKRADGLPECDWKQKISFAISVQDICQLVDANDKRLFHKNEKQGVIKTLQFLPGEGQYAGTWRLILSEDREGAKKQIYVPFTGGEFAVLQKLLVESTKMMLGWQ